MANAGYVPAPLVSLKYTDRNINEGWCTADIRNILIYKSLTFCTLDVSYSAYRQCAYNLFEVLDKSFI